MKTVLVFILCSVLSAIMGYEAGQWSRYSTRGTLSPEERHTADQGSKGNTPASMSADVVELSRLKHADLSQSAAEAVTGRIASIVQRSLSEALQLFHAYVAANEPNMANQVLAHLSGTPYRDELDYNAIAARLFDTGETVPPIVYASLVSDQVFKTATFPQWITQVPEDARGLVFRNMLESMDTVDFSDPRYMEILSSFSDSDLRNKAMTTLLEFSYESNPSATLSATLQTFDADVSFTHHVETIADRWYSNDPVGLKAALELLRSDPAQGAPLERLLASGACPTVAMCLNDSRPQ